MVKKVSLLEQVYAYEKHKSIEGLEGDLSQMNMSQILEKLLPNYDQQTKPRAFHEAAQLHKGLRGGVRSGKTFSLEAEAIGLSYINRPYYHLSVSPSFDLACVTVVPTLEQLCEENNLSYEWSKSNNLFKIFWGTKKNDIARILIFGADSNFKGITAASGDLNEPFSISKTAFLVWWERISHPKAKRMARIWGGTAEPEKMTWGHEYYEMESRPDEYEVVDGKEKLTKPGIYLGTITTYDNKYLTHEYLLSLEAKYDDKMKLVYMMGQNVNLSGLSCYYAFDKSTNIVQYEPTIQYLEKQSRRTVIFSFDFNLDPMSGAELNIDIPGKRIFQVDDYKIRTSNTAELIQLMLARARVRYDILNTSFIITGDAAGKHGDTRSKDRTRNDYTVIKEEIDSDNIKALAKGLPLIQYTFSVEASNPFVWDRMRDINNLFEKKQFYITANCKSLIEDRGLLSWKKGAEGFHLDKGKKNSEGETVGHLSDASDYGALLWKTKFLVKEINKDSGVPESYFESSNRW